MSWVIRVALASALGSTAAPAQDAPDTPTRPDTSNWKCERCPDVNGYQANYSLGGTYVSDDAARFGSGTGYEDEGEYVFGEGTGRLTSDAYRMQWDLTELGTDARSVKINGGQPGLYEYRLGYDELPYRLFDTTQTIFRGERDWLSLPSFWVRGGTTGGMTALDLNLFDREIGTDRTTYQLGGEFEGLDNFQFDVNYRRTEREGYDIVGASFFSNTSLLAAPLDDQTDVIDASIAYTQERWFVQLALAMSEYQSDIKGWLWENPFSGPQVGYISQYPDNEAQQLTLSGAYQLPWRTTVALSASMGEMTQDDELLPYSINFTSPALPTQRFDGQVDTTQYDIRITSQPWQFLRLRALYRQDDRDNESPVGLWTRTIADVFPSGESERNWPYSFSRTRMGVSAAARLEYFEWLKALRFEAGYDRVETRRSLQEVRKQEEDTGWGRVVWRASAGPEVSLRAGASRRTIDGYDREWAMRTQWIEQNPYMRKFNLAYRFRDFVELRASSDLFGLPLTLGAEAYYATDDYSESTIGLRKADDRRFAADLTWAMSDNAAAYIQAAYEDIEYRTLNSERFVNNWPPPSPLVPGVDYDALPDFPPDWRARNADLFRTVSAGVDFNNLLDERLGVRFNATYADGTGNVEVNSTASGGGFFPQIETELLSLTLDTDLRLTDALDLRLRLRYEDFSSSDWALENVEPATIPSVLTLGADPFNYDVYLISLSVRYWFGRASASAASEEQSTP